MEEGCIGSITVGLATALLVVDVAAVAGWF